MSTFKNNHKQQTTNNKQIREDKDGLTLSKDWHEDLNKADGGGKYKVDEITMMIERNLM